MLILGSGMDTRAWRLPLPDVTVVEVDVPAVVRAKEEVLKRLQEKEGHLPPLSPSSSPPETSPPSSLTQLTVKARIVIPANFTATAPPSLPSSPSSWVQAVRAGLPAPEKPLVILLEGLLMYLPEDAVKEVLTQAGRMGEAPGSVIGISLVDRESVKSARNSSSPLRQTWQWGCDEEEARAFFERWLGGEGGGEGGKEGGREGGWKVVHVTRVGRAGKYPRGANYGCWPRGGKGKRKGKTLYVLAEKM